MNIDQARKDLEDAETALADAIREGAPQEKLDELDSATIAAELAVSDAGG